MRYIKSNSGLGHRQYVYLMHLKNEGQYKHLVLNSIGMYEAGSVVEIEPYESDGMVEKEEALSFCSLHIDLIELLEKM